MYKGERKWREGRGAAAVISIYPREEEEGKKRMGCNDRRSRVRPLPELGQPFYAETSSFAPSTYTPADMGQIGLRDTKDKAT